VGVTYLDGLESAKPDLQSKFKKPGVKKGFWKGKRDGVNNGIRITPARFPAYSGGRYPISDSHGKHAEHAI
jgi:hypothetical protein